MFKRFIKWLRDGEQNRKDRETLYRMTDRELKDIGITRGDIDRVMK